MNPILPPAARLAVVIPVHDRADLAARCFAALELWKSPLDVTVVDDGSRDPGVAELRGRYSRWRWLRNETPEGFSRAINRGVAASCGDPILLLNSDAEVERGGDAALAAALARHPEAGAIAARLAFPDGRPQWSGGAEPSNAWLFALASGLGERRGRRRSRPSGFAGGEVEWAPAAALAIRRAAWNAVGPLDESFVHYAQDLDYGHRLREAGFGIRVAPEFSVTHALGGSSGDSALSGQRLDRLWSDLLLWVGKARGAKAARRARTALRIGGIYRRIALRWRGDATGVCAVDRALAALDAAR